MSKLHNKKFDISISDLIIVLIFLIYSIISINSKSTNNGILYTLGAVEKYSIVGLLQGYRIITANFVNNSFINLIASSLVLYNFGNMIDSNFGKVKFLITFFLSGIFCNTMFLLFGSGISCGTYGSACGLIGFYITLIIKDKKHYTKLSRNIILFFILSGVYLFFYDQTASVLTSSLGFIIGVILNIDNIFDVIHNYHKKD